MTTVKSNQIKFTVLLLFWYLLLKVEKFFLCYTYYYWVDLWKEYTVFYVTFIHINLHDE